MGKVATARWRSQGKILSSLVQILNYIIDRVLKQRLFKWWRETNPGEFLGYVLAYMTRTERLFIICIETELGKMKPRDKTHGWSIVDLTWYVNKEVTLGSFSGLHIKTSQLVSLESGFNFVGYTRCVKYLRFLKF